MRKYPMVLHATVIDYADGDSDQSDLLLELEDGVLVTVYMSMN